MLTRPLTALALVALLAPGVAAQRGDRPGEAQPRPPISAPIPDATPKSPDEERATFVLDPGLEIELVAAEPLVGDPVAATFDARGRLWVVEMRGFMPDIDGFGEDLPEGRIVVLQDRDHDGRMDESTVFADGLVLPRAIAIVKDGVLFMEPPYLRFFSDRDQDLVPEDDLIVASGFGGLQSPEHAANGLVRNLDNHLYLANGPFRFRDRGGRFEIDASYGGGQWGLSQDDFGRLFYNYNSDQLRADLVPSALAVRNRNLGAADGVNVRIAKDQRVRPIRPTPGINRGYEKGMLDEQGRLARFTAACAPLVYRGDALPPEYRGDAFVCEPAGHLLKRNRLQETATGIGAIEGEPGPEFLASTDERFRPVNLLDGPDGGLYVVDFYRGVIQHRVFVTTYLRREVEARSLAAPIGLGRIWRISAKGRARPAFRPLDARPSRELVSLLDAENGWTRDTAQRLLVERGDAGIVPELEKLVADALAPRTRLHALWTLEGLLRLRTPLLAARLDDPSPMVRAHAARLLGERARSAEAAIAAEARAPAILAAIVARAKEHPLVARFAALAAATDDALVELAIATAADRSVASGLAAAAAGREEALLLRFRDLAADAAPPPGIEDVTRRLARAIAATKQAAEIGRLLDLAARTPRLRNALLDGIADALPPRPAGRRRRPVRFVAEPPALATLADDPGIAPRVAALRERLAWPSKGGPEDLPPPPLVGADLARFERGRALYAATCAGCHQPDGRGFEGLAPPLRDSEWVEGGPGRMVRIATHGLTGKIMVGGREYDLDMPPFERLGDEELAAILTFVRRSFDHEESPVDAAKVKEVRARAKERALPWRAAELKDLVD